MISEKQLRKEYFKTQIKEDALRYKTLFRRIISGIIDGAVITIPAIPLALLFSNKINGRFVILSIIIQICSLVYNIVLIGKYGTTYGKMLLGLQVVTVKDEVKPSYWDSIKREMINMIKLIFYFGLFLVSISLGDLSLGDDVIRGRLRNDLWSLISLLILVITYSEIISAMFSMKNRAIHDLLGGTVVVKSKELKIESRIIISVIIAFVIWTVYFRLYGMMR